MARRACGSSPAVGSSRKTSSGLLDDGHREREPLLLAAGQPPVSRTAATAEAQALDQRVHVQRMRVQFGHVAQHLVGAGARVDAAGLEHHADPGTQGRGLAYRVEPQYAYRPRVRLAVPLAGLDRGRLARPVGTQYGGDPRPGHQVEAVHRGLRAVPLHQGLDLDDGVASHGPSLGTR